MKQYDVKITGKALADMEAIYNYIAEKLQAPDTAGKQYDRIAEGIASLRTFPNRFRLFDTEPEQKLGFRQLLVDNYSCIYVVNETQSTVTVLRVLYSASDILSRLHST